MTRNGTRAYRFGRAIQTGRVWTNCRHAYSAHAAFGGYKQSGIGRENHKMMLDHYQQTQEPAGQLLAEEAGLLLRPRPADRRCGSSAGKSRKPGDDYVEIMAFLLQQNGYPAGSKTLTFEEAKRSKVKLVYRGD